MSEEKKHLIIHTEPPTHLDVAIKKVHDWVFKHSCELYDKYGENITKEQILHLFDELIRQNASQPGLTNYILEKIKSYCTSSEFDETPFNAFNILYVNRGTKLLQLVDEIKDKLNQDDMSYNSEHHMAEMATYHEIFCGAINWKSRLKKRFRIKLFLLVLTAIFAVLLIGFDNFLDKTEGYQAVNILGLAIFLFIGVVTLYIEYYENYFDHPTSKNSEGLIESLPYNRDSCYAKVIDFLLKCTGGLDRKGKNKGLFIEELRK